MLYYPNFNVTFAMGQLDSYFGTQEATARTKLDKKNFNAAYYVYLKFIDVFWGRHTFPDVSR